MNLQYEIKLDQRQTLSQTQIQSLEILAMDNISLNDYMQNEYMENAILEYTPSDTDVPIRMEDYKSWYDKNVYSGYGETAAASEEHQKEFVSVNQYELRHYLKNQLSLKKYTSRQLYAIDYLIDCLDSQGYYQVPVREAAQKTGASESDVSLCLTDLRQLEPCGIFSENLSQCLLRQLDAQGIQDEKLRAIITSHLEDVASGRISLISRSLGLSTVQVRKYIYLIQKLNPRPLQGFSTSGTTYIVPDIILIYSEGQWEIQMNDSWMGAYHINDYYYKMMRTAEDDDIYAYFRNCLHRARFLLNSLEQRRKTMLRITKTIANYQQEFFLGKGLLRPMMLEDISSALNIHISTVSRGISGKYLQYPGGTILMRDLFTTAVSGSSPSEGLTAEQVKQRLSTLIASEDKEHPLSDQMLVTRLSEHDIHISRRTVAKYREELGIPKSFDRRLIEISH